MDLSFNPPPSASAPWGGQAPSPEKSCQLLIREYPHRDVAVVSATRTLILRHSSTTGDAIANGSLVSVSSARPRTTGADSAASKCIVEFSPTSRQTLADYRPLIPRPIYGTLGLISVGRDVFLCVVTHAARVATVRPGETVERILSVQFFCLNSAEYDDVVSVDLLDPDGGEGPLAYGQSLGRREVQVEHPCHELQKLLSNGTFYYSTDFDLTNRLQDRPVDASTFDMGNFDESFLWNSYMISPLVQFRSRLQAQDREALDASRILTSAIRGFCLTITIPQSSAPLRATRTGLPSFLTVISRLSCRRAGTRFNARGIDDDGNVANFVETETIYWSPSGVLFSYAQVRGSVPVFWEQTAGLLPGQQQIQITRDPEPTQPAFDKHFEDLEQTYGAVHVVNLLSQTKTKEAELTRVYRYGIAHCPLSYQGEKHSQDHALLRSTEYDFHAETKGPSGYEAAREIRRYIEDSADGFAYYLAEELDDSVNGTNGSSQAHRRLVVVLQQEGVFRTNCLDCLDRTNLIQTIISQMVVEAFLGHKGEFASSDFWMRHSSLWADNGDALSRTYAGTGALKSSFTRHGKMSFAGAMADARKSATRLWINNFEDKARQSNIDMLLGRLFGQVPVLLYDPISDYVSAELQKRSSEFSAEEKINIFVGTFNLNGRTAGVEEDLSPWICPDFLGSTQPEIVALGFQEIVELSPQQIMNSDPTRRQLWERAVKRTLDAHAARIGGEKYLLLRSGQLVGAALCIFVKSSVLHKIKNAEGGVKKTGLSGIAGNKGAVAIRFDYANTHLCFVTAHLAAGFSNYDERNKDYATIHHGLRFQRNRGIDDHDTVIWFGDFNYRIGLTSEVARELIRQGDLERLYENDQLNLQMIAGLAFPFYSEARITFLPTYKFDIGKDEYDTSEKARIPAWTDRILRKGTNLRQSSYYSAPLRFSDHRPVYATFDCTVSIVNESLRDKISQEIYERRKAEVGDATANLDSAETDDEELIGYDAVEPGLPPASSDRQKWWLDNGKMARSTMTPPIPISSSHYTIPNPKRPHNPFVPTDESDWVTVPRSESRLSSFSSLSTSPYEHVNHSTVLGTSASSVGPRKIAPPPFDPSALPGKIARMQLNDEPQSQRQATPPLPPPPRRRDSPASRPAPTQLEGVNHWATMTTTERTAPAAPPRRPSSAASQKTARSKPAPPVAKKPPHLSSASSSSSVSPAVEKATLMLAEKTPRPTPPRRSSTSVQGYSPVADGKAGGSAVPPAKPPRRAGTEAGTRHAGNTRPVGPAGDAAGDSRPQLPQRKPRVVAGGDAGGQAPSRMKAVDLLGDDTPMGVGSWEALQPRGK